MNDALKALTAAQHGLLARYQALEKGMSAGQWSWIARSDDWERLHMGVYRRVGTRRTWEQAQMAGCLAADGLASHQAAGTLWGLPGVEQRLERIALEGYRAGLLPEPHFEYPVQLADGRWRYPDVGYPTVAVGFEAVSYEHHSTLPAFAADAERTIDLFGEGWVIVPITEIQVREPERLVARMARIIAAVEARRLRA